MLIHFPFFLFSFLNLLFLFFLFSFTSEGVEFNPNLKQSWISMLGSYPDSKKIKREKERKKIRKTTDTTKRMKKNSKRKKSEKIWKKNKYQSGFSSPEECSLELIRKEKLFFVSSKFHLYFFKKQNRVFTCFFFYYWIFDFK